MAVDAKRETLLLVFGAKLALGLCFCFCLDASNVFAADKLLKTSAPSVATVPDQKKSATVPEPKDYRMQDYRSPVPVTLKGANVLSGREAEAMWEKKSAIFIDVYPHPPKPPNLPADTIWREPTHHSIENAVWLPNVGYGKLAPQTESYFRENLKSLTGDDKHKPLVFFCLRNCWMSWNAAKRAIEYGYANVHWFPDGTDVWQEIGQMVLEVRPAPQKHQAR